MFPKISTGSIHRISTGSIHRISTNILHRFVFLSILPVLLAVMMMIGYPGNTPVIQAAGTPGALVPMGDELGDVGQYYSQVDPSQLSRLGIYNPNSSSVSVSVSLYPDGGTGTVITTTCTIAANTGVEVRTDTITQTVCSNLSAQPRGVYHGVITSSGGNVAVANWVNNDTTMGNPLVSSAYEAVQAGITSTTHYLYGVLVRGTSGNDWTDTEFVVQNPSTTTDAYVQFTLCESNGTTCWNNNSAVVPKNGHRVFLLSQLAYQNSGGSLTEKSGGLSAKLTVTNSVPVATMANMFRQTVPTTKTLPMAETGAKWMVSFGQQRAASSGVIPRFYRESGDSSGGYSHAVKVQNLGASSTTVTVELRDASGNVPTNGTVSKSVGANAVVGFNSYEFNVAAGTYAARIYSSGSNSLAAWHWRSGSVGYYGDVWQPVDTSNNNVYFPVARKDFDSWHTAFGYYTSGSSSRSSRAIEQFLTNYYSNGQSNTVGAFFAGLYHHAWSTTTSGDNAPSGNTNGLFRGRAALDNGSSPIRLMPVIYKSGSGDTRVAYNATWQTASTWYVPFAPAPVVAFAWQSKSGTTHPSGEYGIARAQSGDKTGTGAEWVEDLNWIGWSAEVSYCNRVSPVDGYSRYIPAWAGLSIDGLADNNSDGYWDSSTANTVYRLGKIRNAIPSACAGRPLRIMNEANNAGDPGVAPGVYQAAMTYPEQGRATWIFRTWPGDLMGPSYIAAHPDWNMLLNWTCGSPSATVSVSPFSTMYPGNKNWEIGKYHAGATCWDGFEYFLGQSGEMGISGTSYEFEDFYDTLEAHFYISTARFGSTPIDSGNNPYAYTSSTTAKADADKRGSRASARGLPIVLSEYGLLSTGTGQEQFIADRMATFDEAIDLGMGTSTRRFWFTDYCTSSTNGCPTEHQADRIFTSTDLSSMTTVGSRWDDVLEDR